MDYLVESVDKVTDGDTVRLSVSRTIELNNEFSGTIESSSPKGLAIRLIILNTPERGTPEFSKATEDLRAWLNDREGRLRVETYESAGWDRLLGDVYTEGDRSDTATQHMLKLGWEPYLGSA